MSTVGAVYLAHEQQQIQRPAPRNQATAQLYELAAYHDHAHPADWLRTFWRVWDNSK